MKKFSLSHEAISALIIFVMGMVLILVGMYFAGREHAIKKELEALQATKMGMTQQHFDEFCGDPEIILMRVKNYGKILLIVRLDDWLQCIGK